jgi:hypothetical protein
MSASQGLTIHPPTPVGGGGGGAPGPAPLPPAPTPAPPPGGAGTVPTPTPLPGSNPLPYQGAGPGYGGTVPGTNTFHLDPTYDPAYTGQYYNTIQQMLGTGLPGFNLQTALPSGGTTGAGQLNAPLNSTLQGIQNFLGGYQSNVPGSNALNQMANTGNPVDQTAAWQAMLGSEQQNIQQNQADIKEQFAFGGALGGSEFGNAMQNYMSQVTADQNAQLTQATATAQENAMNRQLSAQQGIQGEANQFGSGVQNLDQSAIQNMLNEFNYTLPQNNPLWQLMGQSASASPGLAQTASASQTFSNIAGGIGSLL